MRTFRTRGTRGTRRACRTRDRFLDHRLLLLLLDDRRRLRRLNLRGNRVSDEHVKRELRDRFGDDVTR